MDKILFIVSDYEQAKSVFPHYVNLRNSGYELAFYCSDFNVNELMALTKLLVVVPESYNPSLVVANSPYKDFDYLSYKDFLETLQ